MGQERSHSDSSMINSQAHKQTQQIGLDFVSVGFCGAGAAKRTGEAGGSCCSSEEF